MLHHGRVKLGEMEEVLAKCFKENKSGLVHPADVVPLGDLGLFNALHLNTYASPSLGHFHTFSDGLKLKFPELYATIIVCQKLSNQFMDVQG